MAKNGKKWLKMAKIGGKILGSNIYLCKKLTFRNSAPTIVEKVKNSEPGSWSFFPAKIRKADEIS